MQTPPHNDPGYRVLFVDMNAYFASVEQMDNPDLKGRPVAVTPVDTPSGCCIACSYEARRHGIRTGSSVRDAKALCPSVTIVKARPDRYIRVHHSILDAVDTVIPVREVESVDEFWCKLYQNERSDEAVDRIVSGIKAAIWSRVGTLTCSVGVAPNRLLAKVAGDMHKPDGSTRIALADLPGAIEHLDLTDLPGIAAGVNRRLRAAGITTVAQLCSASPERLRAAWGSVVGVYWWHWLRGDQIDGPKTHRRTVGHQHVLAPEYRDNHRARGVAARLLGKAAQRMRSLGYVARRMSLSVHPIRGSTWADWTPLDPTDDSIVLNDYLGRLWADAPKGSVLQVGVRLENLMPRDADLPLFTGEQSRRALMDAIDTINLRNGADAVYLGTMHNERQTAPRRIPFGTPPDLALPDQD